MSNTRGSESLRIPIRIYVSLFPFVRADTSGTDKPTTDSPSMDVIMSPALSPELSAGEPLIMSETTQFPFSSLDITIPIPVTVPPASSINAVISSALR